MGFLRGLGSVSTETKGRRLYILDIEMPSGMQCVKIGVASGNSSLDRMMQINRDIFNKYRCTAKIRIKRDRPVDDSLVFKYETTLHRFFSSYRYIPKKTFDGSTECFAIPLQAAVDVYEYILENGLDSLEEFEYDPLVYAVPSDELPF